MVRPHVADRRRAVAATPAGRRVGHEEAMCQRVAYGRGRGGGRRRGGPRSIALPRLFRATLAVDLRSPVVRRLLASGGDHVAP